MNVPISDGYTTIAGFLMSIAGEILHEGQTVAFNGHVFKIEAVNKRRITRVRMQTQNEAEDTSATAA